MEKEIIIHSENDLKGKIYVIRGVQVMLDKDLAEIYGYATNRFNEQVKNNIEKFDEEDLMFQLTKEEFDTLLQSKTLTAKSDSNLMSKKSTSSWGGTRKLPYAFTEQGLYMLMTVLKGDVATKQSKALVRLFKNAKQNVAVTIFSDNTNNGLHKVEYDDFCKEFPGLKVDVKEAGKIFHDRYIILDYGTTDEKIYHCGASSKDGGRRVTTITLTDDTSVYTSLIAQLLKNKPLVLK